MGDIQIMYMHISYEWLVGSVGIIKAPTCLPDKSKDSSIWAGHTIGPRAIPNHACSVQAPEMAEEGREQIWRIGIN